MYSVISENAISAIKTIFWDRYADATLTKFKSVFFQKKKQIHHTSVIVL